jgi:carbon storage regulator
VLVFTRKRDEAIIIGDGIEVRVLRVGREGVRLGVSAPPQVPIHRREVYDQIRVANATAAGDRKSLNQIAARLRDARLAGAKGRS